MRIGFLSSVSGTAEAFFVDWISLWAQQGHRVFVAAKGEWAHPDADFTLIDSLSQAPALRNVRAIRAIRAWATSNALDVIVTNTATASLLARCWPPPAPVVYFCHGLHYTERSRRSIAALLERLAGHPRLTRAAICMNGFDEAEFARLGVPTLRLAAGVGLRLDRYTVVPPPSEAPPHTLLWVGTLTERKRPADAIEVTRLLLDRGHDVELYLLGAGPLEDTLRRSIEARGLTERIHLVGRCDPRPFLARGAVLVHTAAWEGLCRVLLEAVAVGLPAVGYDVKGVRDVAFVDACTEPGDVERLADRVVLSLGHRDHRLIGEPGWADYRQSLDWSAPADAVLRFLERVITGDTTHGFIGPDHR